MISNGVVYDIISISVRLVSREEPGSAIAMCHNALYINVCIWARSPQFDENVSASTA